MNGKICLCFKNDNGMKIFLIVVLVLLNYTHCQSQKITPITQQDFDNGNFQNLSFLVDELKDVKLIGLGESSHNMGVTYSAKVKFIKYLHKHCGFDVIAFESPMYNLWNVCSSIENDNCTKENIFNNLSSVWYSKELDELFDYVVETRKTNNPLIIAGFDQSVFSDGKTKFSTEYNAFIKKLNSKTNSNIEIDSSFINAIDSNIKNYFSTNKIVPQDTLILRNKFLEIKKSVKKISVSEENNYFLFWDLMTNNLQSLYRSNYKQENIRDKQMAKNVSFLSNQMYKNKKIILWAATLHLHDKPELVVHKKDNMYHDKFMGEFLRNEFNDTYYTVGFTAFSGNIGLKGYLGLGKKRIKSSTNSLENFINKTYNCDYAFISMKNDQNKKIIIDNKLTTSNILGSRPFEMDLTKVVDAYFYIKTENLVKNRNE